MSGEAQQGWLGTNCLFGIPALSLQMPVQTCSRKLQGCTCHTSFHCFLLVSSCPAKGLSFCLESAALVVAKGRVFSQKNGRFPEIFSFCLAQIISKRISFCSRSALGFPTGTLKEGYRKCESTSWRRLRQTLCLLHRSASHLGIEHRPQGSESLVRQPESALLDNLEPLL